MCRLALAKILPCCILAGWSALLARAEDRAPPSTWTQWRGTFRDGVSSETGLLPAWPAAGPPLVWEVDHLGQGYSSLAVTDKQIFTLGNLDGVEHVICLNAADGSVAWAVQPGSARQRLESQVADALARLDANQSGSLDEAEARPESALSLFVTLDVNSDGALQASELRAAYGGFRDDMGEGPRSTPAVDEEFVYTLGCRGDLACSRLETGETVWSLNLLSDFGGHHTGRGYSESPLLEGDHLIVSPGGSAGAVVALDKRSGRVVWRSHEVTEPIQYASAVAADVARERMVIQFSSRGLFGLRAGDGKLLWRYDRISSGVANVCTPLVWQDCVLAASAYGTGAGLVRISHEGEAWRADEVYFNPKLANHHGGVVRVGDTVYGTGSSSLVAMNFLTGEVAWNEHGVGKGTLIAADGRLYLVGEAHRVALAEASPEAYREHGRFELPDLGRPTWSHPVIAGQRLYLRNQQRLSAYDLRAAAQP